MWTAVLVAVPCLAANQAISWVLLPYLADKTENWLQWTIRARWALFIVAMVGIAASGTEIIYGRDLS